MKVQDPKALVLRKRCKKVTIKELKSRRLQEQIEELLNFVYGSSNKGDARDRTKPQTVGLSANQVGIDKSICVVDFGIASNNYNDLHVLINPEIIWESKSIIDRQEGCVNLKHGDIRGIVPRARRVKVKAWDRFGTELTIDAKGLVARVLQHELDHLNGKLFIDHIDNPHKAHLVTDKDRVLYKRTKKEKWDKFIDVTTLVKNKK